MIQFNLLPDVKLEYIKARRTRRMVIMSSILVAGASLTVFVLLFSLVNVAQKQHLKHLQSDIDTTKKELQGKSDLAKILTIQNQLGSLPDLHSKKPIASRVLGYVQQITPQNVSVSTLTVNFSDQTMKIEGSTDSLATVNTFVDTLKFTNYLTAVQQDASGNNQSPKTTDPTTAFSDVVLSDFSLTTSGVKDKNKAASYSITLKYDPAIFNGEKDVTLQVLKRITTRSETEKPSAVFQLKPTTEGAN